MPKRLGTEQEWSEWSPPPDALLPPGPHKKLRIIADAQFPIPIADELRAAKVDIIGPDSTELRAREDPDVLQIARREHRVLLTFDQDFWDDRKHPLQKAPGIIVLATSPSDIDSALRAFALVYAAFAKQLPGDWWSEMKVRASPETFTLRLRAHDGQVRAWQFKSERGRLLVRQVQGSLDAF